MGSYPSVVDWNNDGNPDLLVGDSTGHLYIFLNIGTNPDGTPILDSGTAVQADGADLLVEERAAAAYEDWNGDGYKDLLVGSLTGEIGIYINNGSNAFNYSGNVTAAGWSPVYAGYQSRSAPRVFDWDRDGLKDLLVGEVAGYIWYFRNVTTDPVNTPFVFNTAEKLLLADGVTNVRYTLSGSASPRSRIYITDWNEDGADDIVSGGNDGRLQLFLGEDPDTDNDGVLNKSDLCAFTAIGAVVDPDGCSIEQLTPCQGPREATVSWRNHGQYVSGVANTANGFLQQGLITEEEKGRIVSNAANSTCGQKNRL